MGDVTVGWPVLADDWMSLFPDYRRTKGYKMWMMAADGSRQFGPLGARCFGGAGKYGCAPGNFVGKDLTRPYTGRLFAYLGSAWKDRMPGDVECFRNGCAQSQLQQSVAGWVPDGCYKKNGQHTGFKPASNRSLPEGMACWIEHTTNGTYKLFLDYDRRSQCLSHRKGKCIEEKGKCVEIKFRPNFCLRGEAWLNDNFPKTHETLDDGFRHLIPRLQNSFAEHRSTVDRVYASAVENGTVPDGAQSCRRYYAPKLKLFKLELGIAPGAIVPKGWAQYPLEPAGGRPITAGSAYWYKWVQSGILPS